VNRVFGTLAPFGTALAIVTACGINYFTYWVNPWSMLAWGIGLALMASSTIYFGLQREEMALMLLGVIFLVLALVVYVVPHPSQTPNVGRFVVDVAVDGSALLLWYRVSGGSWPFANGSANGDQTLP
jgi:hypothetical protein